MSILEAAPAGPRRGEVVRTPDIDDLIARHAHSVADLADLLAMFYDEPRKGNAPSRTTRPRNKCGSMKAYRQHLYYGEKTCDACRAANAEYVAGRVRAREGQVVRDKDESTSCGTNRGYHWHHRRGERTCKECRAAHARAEALAKARRALSTGEAE